MLHTSLPEGVRAVVFDVGETLVDETRAWTVLADASGVTPFTLMAALGALIERGEDHRGVWDLLGVPVPDLRPDVRASDLYPDALRCVRAVRSAGLVVGIAGNQPAGVVDQLAGLGFDADLVASSAVWGVQKPSSAFFARIVHELGMPAHAILYVGDRLDNDVVPASAVGMRTAFIRRGPWGALHARSAADLRIETLDELVDAVRAV
jgi:FMN phosphatase YigB (HAD superfamily)